VDFKVTARADDPSLAFTFSTYIIRPYPLYFSFYTLSLSVLFIRLIKHSCIAQGMTPVRKDGSYFSGLTGYHYGYYIEMQKLL